jgi:hypothetical protein
MTVMMTCNSLTVQVERDGVPLEEVDMVVMVITAEKEVDCADAFHKVELSAVNRRLLGHTRKPKADEECVMKALEHSLAGLETAKRHITDVGASAEAEADAQVAGFRVMLDQEITIEPVVPMGHRMGGDRTIEQVQAAETFSTFMWEQKHVHDASEGANAEEIEAIEEARFALPLDFEVLADTWQEHFMDDDGLRKVQCKPNRPAKIVVHKLVSVEETREMLRGLSIGTHEAGCKTKTGLFSNIRLLTLNAVLRQNALM